jgi:4-hydroxy-tetrahydrodipicolinate reductase
VNEEIAQRGGLGTAAVAVNMIPRILHAEPGYYTMNQLILPHFWSGAEAPTPVECIAYC